MSFHDSLHLLLVLLTVVHHNFPSLVAHLQSLGTLVLYQTSRPDLPDALTLAVCVSPTVSSVLLIHPYLSHSLLATHCPCSLIRSLSVDCLSFSFTLLPFVTEARHLRLMGEGTDVCVPLRACQAVLPLPPLIQHISSVTH